ncbi:hypothetical protein GMDG_06046 [Pseudogymnoascus destructans 20631-21]|uniref:Uncharacterized protein n=1 Tax=Pseudogymnoascus destructans (strain ATCC MYA-4855 / 20631-21) TaxID=658429 RepID=L8FS45_PSED2|nr:hypothetical protein GMDG_06046 [Pseudogymnoascus destructans 20631-21]
MPDDPTTEPTNATSAYIILGNFSFLTAQQSRSPNEPYCCRFQSYCSGRGRRWHSFPISAAVKSKPGSALPGACMDDRLIFAMGSPGPRCNLRDRGGRRID